MRTRRRQRLRLHTVHHAEMFQAMCRTIGRPDLVEGPRFKERREWVKYIEDLTRIIEDWTSKRGKREVMQVMGEAGVPCGAILNPSRCSTIRICGSAGLW
jgi:crotonobetainyl-CoA:carnitine CoA-transferase CaiB-like acyl-CoA transferase